MKSYYTDLPILKKLLFAFLLVGIVPMLVVGVNSINNANSTITHQVSNQLESITALKKDAILQYFERIRSQLGQLSQQPIVIDGAQSLSKSFQRFQAENSISQNKLSEFKTQLSQYYVNEFGREFQSKNNADANARGLLDQLSDEAIALQYHYIQANKHPLGEKHNLDRADDNSSYSVAHQKVHPMLRTYLETFGF